MKHGHDKRSTYYEISHSNQAHNCYDWTSPAFRTTAMMPRTTWLTVAEEEETVEGIFANQSRLISNPLCPIRLADLVGQCTTPLNGGEERYAGESKADALQL